MCEELINLKFLSIYEIKKKVLEGGVVVNFGFLVVLEIVFEFGFCFLKCQFFMFGLLIYFTVYIVFCIKGLDKLQSFVVERILFLGFRVLGESEECV